MAFPSPTKTFHREPYTSIDPSRPELSSANKNVVVTGGGRGIGSRIAYAFAKSGAANVAIVGRSEQSLADTKGLIENDFPSTKVHTLVADITDALSVEKSFAAFASSLGGGKIDILAANAGYLHTPKSLDLADSDDWWSSFTINVRGNFNTLRAFLPHAAPDAVVLNISTAATHIRSVPGHSGYAASKLATTKVFDYFAEEHPELRIIQFHPGVIQTDMAKKSAESGVELPVDHSTYSINPKLPSR